LSCGCRKKMCGNFYTDGFGWNLTMLCYETAELGELLESKEIYAEGKPWVADVGNDCVPSSTKTGLHETLQFHATKSLDWESWSCRWRVNEVAPSLSRSHSMWFLSVGLCKWTSVWATSTTGYWWTEVENYRSYRDNCQEYTY
jgi:hypothetical protein